MHKSLFYIPKKIVNIFRNPLVGWATIILILAIPFLYFYMVKFQNDKKDTISYRKAWYEYAKKFCGHEPSIAKTDGFVILSKGSYINPSEPSYPHLLKLALTPHARTDYSCGDSANSVWLPD